MTSPNPLRPNNFDLLRLLAAAQVVLFHVLEHLQPADRLPHVLDVVIRSFPGVPIFFLISGFLISASFESSTTLGSYFRKRALRIFPALWLCFFLSVVSVWLLTDLLQGASAGGLAVWVFAQLSVFQFYNPGFLREYGLGSLNGSLWSIPVEIQFYIVLPVLYAGLRKFSLRASRWLAGLILVFMLLSQFISFALQPLTNTLIWKLLHVTALPYLWFFLLGVFAQQHFIRLRHLFADKLVLWLIIHAGAVAVTYFLQLPYGSNNPFPLTGLSLCGLSLAFAYSSVTLSKRLLGHTDISYGLYIYHAPVINAFITLGWTGDAWVVMAVFAVSLLLAWLSWIVIERPAQSLK